MKKGFTLAEVLITLGIIGVVASLTLPSLVKNTGQAEVGPKLAKFVNTFENGVSNAMRAMQTNLVSEAAISDAKFLELLSNYIVMTPAPANTTYSTFLERDVKDNDDSLLLLTQYANLMNQSLINKYGNINQTNIIDSFNSNDGNLYILKDGSLIYYKQYDEIGNHKGPYKGIIGEIVYDIDGLSGNNIAGREAFKFFLDNSGDLIPYGSQADEFVNDIDRKECGFIDYNISKVRSDCFNSGGYHDTQDSTCFENKYKKYTQNRKDAIDAAYSCTGQIADNGYKAEY